jgi:hypothetical protein
MATRNPKATESESKAADAPPVEPTTPVVESPPAAPVVESPDAPKAPARMLAVPDSIKFSTGKGETRKVLDIKQDRLTDGVLTAMMNYGSRLFNDTRNGAKKDAWGSLSIEDAFTSWLEWVESDRPRAIGESLASPIAEAVKEYLASKRKVPAWTAAEEKAWPKDDKGKSTRPNPRSLETLKDYLAKLNGLESFPEDKWEGISSVLEANAKEIEDRRKALADEASKDEDASMLF